MNASRSLALFGLTALSCLNGVSGVSAERACLLAVSCFEGAFDCDTLGYLGPSKIDCIANASGDCAKLRSCLGVEITSDGTCTGTQCDGAHLIQCDGETRTDIDCTRYSTDSTCIDNQGAPGCGIDTCSGQVNRCDGTHMLSCENGIVSSTDCALLGLSCNLTPDGFPQCAGQGLPCDGDVELTHCEANVLVGCIGGHKASRDCGKQLVGSACLSSGDTSFCGFASQCPPLSGSCSGSELSLCAFGVMQKVDCAKLGFVSCQTNMSDMTVATTAWCSPQ